MCYVFYRQLKIIIQKAIENIELRTPIFDFRFFIRQTS